MAEKKKLQTDDILKKLSRIDSTLLAIVPALNGLSEAFSREESALRYRIKQLEAFKTQITDMHSSLKGDIFRIRLSVQGTGVQTEEMENWIQTANGILKRILVSFDGEVIVLELSEVEKVQLINIVDQGSNLMKFLTKPLNLDALTVPSESPASVTPPDPKRPTPKGTVIPKPIKSIASKTAKA